MSVGVSVRTAFLLDVVHGSVGMGTAGGHYPVIGELPCIANWIKKGSGEKCLDKRTPALWSLWYQNDDGSKFR